jgi:hypothetical protein
MNSIEFTVITSISVDLSKLFLQKGSYRTCFSGIKKPPVTVCNSRKLKKFELIIIAYQVAFFYDSLIANYFLLLFFS